MQAFPDELRFPPKPVVHVMGMDTIHSTLLSSLNAGDERCKFHLAVSEFDTKFPAKKVKHEYDHYSPSGILKDNWMKKHKLMMPAVVLLLHDMNTSDSDLSLKERIVERVEAVRNNFNGHTIKIAVVLVISQTDLAQVDKIADGVRRGLDADSKTVFTLNMTTATLSTSIQRLEQVLVDLCSVFYKDEGRRVKRYKEKLNKLNQAHMLVRHSFKIAYYAEFRNDHPAALKYYQIAYSFVPEVLKNTSLDVHEVKVVAGYINFRMSILLAQSHHHLEAVDQFQNHMLLFRNKVGRPKLAMLHYSWMATQHQMMGELLEAYPCAIVGTQSNRLLHPAHYFMIAAQHARAFRVAVSATQKELSGHVPSSVTNPSVLFVGQLPQTNENDLAWYFLERADKMLQDTVLGLLERAHRFYLQRTQQTRQTEAHVAIPQRHNRTIAAQIAEEYLEQGNYEAAKSLLDRIAVALRDDGWSNLLTRSLRQARMCARQLGSVPDFVLYSLQLCSPQLGLDSWGRLDMFDQTMLLLSNFASNPDSSKDPFAVLSGTDIPTLSGASGGAGMNSPASGSRHHRKGLSKRVSEVVASGALVRADLDKDHPFMTCRIRFHAESGHINEPVQFFVHLRLFAPRAMTFHALYVSFSEQALDACVRHAPTAQDKDIRTLSFELPPQGLHTSESNLCFQPNQERIFSFQFTSAQSVFLECTSIVLCATPAPPTKEFPEIRLLPRDSDDSHALALVWRGTDKSRSKSWVNVPNLPGLASPIEWEVIPANRREISCISVVVPEPQVSITLNHHSPPLVAELYPATIAINSNSDELCEGVVSLEASVPLSEFVFASFDNSQPVPAPEGFSLPAALSPQTTHHITVWLRSFVAGDRTLTVKIRYKSRVGSLMSIDETFPLTFVPPFKFSSSIRTQYAPNTVAAESQAKALASGRSTSDSEVTDMQTQSVLHLSSPASLVIDMDTDTPHRLRLLECSLRLVNDANTHMPIATLHSQESFLCPADPPSTMGTGDRQSFVFSLEPVAPCINQPLGTIDVMWIREDPIANVRADAGGLLTKFLTPPSGFPPHFVSTFELLPVTFIASPFTVTLTAPSNGTVGQPLEAVLAVRNNTPSLQQLALSVNDSDVFLLSGPAAFHVTIIPWMTVDCRMIFVPVRSGTMTLPVVQVTSQTMRQGLLSPSPPQVFVVPSAISLA